MKSIGMLGTGRSSSLSTSLITAMIMNEVPPELIELSERKKETGHYVELKPEDLERITKAEVKRMRKLIGKDQQRISSQKMNSKQ